MIPVAPVAAINWNPLHPNYSRSSTECGMPSSIDIFEVASSTISAHTSDDAATPFPMAGPPGSFSSDSTPRETSFFTPSTTVELPESTPDEKMVTSPGPAKKVRRYNKRRKSVIFDSDNMSSVSDDFQPYPSQGAPDQLLWSSYGESNPTEEADNYTPLVWVEQTHPSNNVDLPAPAPAKEYTFVWEFPQERKTPEPDRKISSSPQPRKSPQ
jgi:hypothetical protein